MPMYKLIEYSDNYSKTSGSLRQYCKNISAVDNNNAILKLAEIILLTNLILKQN